MIRKSGERILELLSSILEVDRAHNADHNAPNTNPNYQPNRDPKENILHTLAARRRRQQQRKRRQMRTRPTNDRLHSSSSSSAVAVGVVQLLVNALEPPPIQIRQTRLLHLHLATASIWTLLVLLLLCWRWKASLVDHEAKRDWLLLLNASLHFNVDGRRQQTRCESWRLLLNLCFAQRLHLLHVGWLQLV